MTAKGNSMGSAAVAGILVAAAILSCSEGAAAGDRPPAYPDPARFAAEVAAFVSADSLQPPPANGVVCVGSSSMRMWHDSLAADLAPLPVVPRGFGGSTMYDLLSYAQPLVLSCRPRAILLYEGDNDIDFGVSPQELLATFRRFVDLVQASLPETRIFVISIKPSPARWAIWPRMSEANRLLAADCAAHPLLHYIDVATPMLAPDGRPRPELYLPDDLHLNRRGYELWTAVIRPVLLADSAVVIPPDPGPDDRGRQRE